MRGLTNSEDQMPRCLIVSNRLPVAYNEKTNDFTQTSGGLVSAIKGLDPEKIGFNFEWMGILTDDTSSECLEKLKTSHSCDFPCHPILAPKKIYDHYYNSYCNNVLWPLFHYERNMVRHNQAGWKAYCEINQLVADKILETVGKDDIVWIHDFHFFLVPGFIKNKNPKIKTGFFLHIPFPSSEIYRELPHRREILESLLRCDQIGFHDLSYLNHFRSSVQRVLGEVPSNEKMWGVYPISIDVDYFLKLADAPETQEHLRFYRENKKNVKWILGIDRLDYIKGLPLKLSAFKAFLKKYPEERGKVQLVQIVVPSRTDVPEYKNLKAKIEQMVSSINGEFGSPTWVPIQYIFRSVTENELSALYQLSNVLHVGSRRDGMNLVSLEYVMSQKNGHSGAVVLSEFAGAHSTLSYALTINPWNIQETASKIHQALKLPSAKKSSDMNAMKKFLTGYTSSDWAKDILKDLLEEPKLKEIIRPLPVEGSFDWMSSLKDKKVLVFCDLDGTLAPIHPHPKDVRLQTKTIELLQEFSQRPNCEFVIVSGRDREFLEEQFIDNDFELPLAACHGAYSYLPDDQKWHNLVPNDSTKWKAKVLDILELYTKRTPESFIEDKGHALTWHYRMSPAEFAQFMASKLFFELESNLIGQPVIVSRGKKVIEIKSIHANKGYFVQQWIRGLRKKPDIVVAIGDDLTDEDMFSVLNERKDVTPYCIKVGDEESKAKYFIRDQQNVNLFLGNFLDSISSH